MNYISCLTTICDAAENKIIKLLSMVAFSAFSSHKTSAWL